MFAVYITPSWGTGGYQLPGENGSFVALRLLRMTEKIITAQDDRGSFARCTLRAVDDRLCDRCYVNHVIFNSQLSIVNYKRRILRRKAPQDDQGNRPEYCVILRRSRRIRCYYFCWIG